MNRTLFAFLLLIAIGTITVRLLPHMPNFTPMGALALFVGVYLAKAHKAALLLPLLAMFLSDLFIGFYDAKLMAVVYGSFLSYGVIGMLVVKQKNAQTVLLGSIGGAVIFYLTTNFAVWAFSSWYPHTLSGLMLSYTLALPFFKYTLLGDVFFSALFFGAYEFAKTYMVQREAKIAVVP
ncbi:MAG: hypothetical protein Greene041639_76 [Parcubacteria group bacterium Greene0416_39]|nr:MAG: hypothetical protein Greene041639_76 [Parcubacteria group bacterium Greene0416_39]TSC98187.1 MAG: hypothetical protein Greene101447_150 [Parcubacteria group bacterium Greene1014_47]